MGYFRQTHTGARSPSALLTVGSELNCYDLLLLTDNVERTEQHTWFGKSGEIKINPLWKWLIEQDIPGNVE
jgi:hypothetical protein